MWDIKSVEDRWAKARALYGVNKSFREIEAELDIPRSTLNRRALREGWRKGDMMPLVHKMVAHKMQMAQLTPELRKHVEQRVQRTLKLEAEYKAAPNPWLKKLIAAR